MKCRLLMALLLRWDGSVEGLKNPFPLFPTLPQSLGGRIFPLTEHALKYRFF